MGLRNKWPVTLALSGASPSIARRDPMTYRTRKFSASLVALRPVVIVVF